MKHIIHKLFSLIKRIFFFFRVIVTLEIGKKCEDTVPEEPKGKDQNERS